ncbi:hypothetical protein CTA1_2803 [Colletotrichum tanaceti]|uniref:Uncharacterized protein n=1 Tax=Colletotrichum tanaceti TaxID=1306861 RepID=A0A4U6X0W3_9PEZI|nr:hypothetical protein CTA1_2803 [Colletotrichum tanaceti]
MILRPGDGLDRRQLGHGQRLSHGADDDEDDAPSQCLPPSVVKGRTHIHGHNLPRRHEDQGEGQQLPEGEQPLRPVVSYNTTSRGAGYGELTGYPQRRVPRAAVGVLVPALMMTVLGAVLGVAGGAGRVDGGVVALGLPHLD